MNITDTPAERAGNFPGVKNMNRMLWVYILTAVVFVAGLWGILRAGSKLRAAPDVAGTWNGDGPALVVEQSGVWVRVKRDGAKVESYKMVNVTDGTPRRAVWRGEAGKVVAMEFEAASARLTLAPFPDGPVSFTRSSATTQSSKTN